MGSGIVSVNKLKFLFLFFFWVSSEIWLKLTRTLDFQLFTLSPNGKNVHYEKQKNKKKNTLKCCPLHPKNKKNIKSGYLGASACMILSSWGSAWGTWRAGLGVCNMGIDHPAGIIKNIVPIVMAGVLGIYGLIVSVIITQSVVPPSQSDHTNTYSVYNGYTHVSFLDDCFFLFFAFFFFFGQCGIFWKDKLGGLLFCFDQL